MNTLSPYLNSATFHVSFFRDKVKKLRTEYPNISVLQVKIEIVDMMISGVECAVACSLIREAANTVDWEFIYNDI
jgi:hypothetical protein